MWDDLVNQLLSIDAGGSGLTNLRGSITPHPGSRFKQNWVDTKSHARRHAEASSDGVLRNGLWSKNGQIGNRGALCQFSDVLCWTLNSHLIGKRRYRSMITEVSWSWECVSKHSTRSHVHEATRLGKEYQISRFNVDARNKINRTKEFCMLKWDRFSFVFILKEKKNTSGNIYRFHLELLCDMSWIRNIFKKLVCRVFFVTEYTVFFVRTVTD